MNQTPSRWEDVVATNVRQAREAQGLLQEELARLVRLLGLKWSYTTVVRLEGGHREPSLREIVALSTALQMPLSELLAGGDGTVGLRPGVAAQIAVVRGNIAANRPALPLAALDVQQAIDTWDVALAAERHAAKRVGCSVEELRAVAQHLWGRPYHVERDRRLQEVLTEARPDPESRRAQRGHVSRRLLAEVRSCLDKREGPQ